MLDARCSRQVLQTPNSRPLLAFGKSWREHELEGGDWNDALYPISTGFKQAIDKVHTREGAAKGP